MENLSESTYYTIDCKDKEGNPTAVISFHTLQDSQYVILHHVIHTY